MSLFKEKLELKIEEAEFNAQRALTGFPPVLKWVLVALIVGLVPSYFISKAISYKYWESKYKPYQAKAKPSFSEFKDLSIGDPKVLTYSDGTYGAVAKISNLNPDLSAENVQFAWTYYNASGQKITPQNSEAVSGSFYILQNSEKYIIALKIFSSDPIAKTELNLTNEVKWQKRFKNPTVLLSVSPATSNQQTSPLIFSVESSVVNNSPYLVRQVNLTFLLYGQNNQIVAVSQRTENDLRPLEKRAFKQLWPGLFITPSKIEVLAETNTLSSQNLVAPKNQNNASDLQTPETENNWGF